MLVSPWLRIPSVHEATGAQVLTAVPQTPVVEQARVLLPAWPAGHGRVAVDPAAVEGQPWSAAQGPI